MERNSYSTITRTAIDGIFVGNKDRTYTANEICDILEEIGIKANKTTIYRYLTFLVENKTLIKFVAEKGGLTVYKYNDKKLGCDSHLHLKCSVCGKVEHLSCNDMQKFNDHISKEHGFYIDCSTSVLYGKCKDCKDKGDI